MSALRRRRTPALRALASGVLALLSSVTGVVAGVGLTEPSTGASFPLLRAAPGTDAPLDLTGVGVRKRLVFKVYAFGLYVDGAAARRELARWAGHTAEALAGDEEFYRALTTLNGDRLAVLHFVRSVSADQMRTAMTEALDRGVAQNDPARTAFLNLWTSAIADGEDVLLHFSADGAVTLLRGGAAVGTVRSAEVSRSLLESWLGPRPVSENIQRGVAARVPAILAN